MKKNVILIGCWMFMLLGGSSVLGADAKPSGGMVPLLGLEGGINLATLRGLHADQAFESRLGFVGGGFLSIPLGSTLALQPEVLYSQKGGRINGFDYRLDYVEVPILLDISLGGPGIIPGILMGPSFDSLSANHGVPHIVRSDVGLVLGVQWIFNRFLLSGRYEVGLDDVSSDEAVKNGTFTFMAGFSIL